jgi:hypothetical protein
MRQACSNTRAPSWSACSFSKRGARLNAKIVVSMNQGGGPRG